MSDPTRLSDQKTKNRDPCSLFSMVQYECSPAHGKITCWPLERIFRQCGDGKPAVEVTNNTRLIDGKVVVDQSFIDRPPKGKKWHDVQ